MTRTAKAVAVKDVAHDAVPPAPRAKRRPAAAATSAKATASPQDPPPIAKRPWIRKALQHRTLDAALSSFPAEAFTRPWPTTGRNGLHSLLQLPATTASIARLLLAVTAPLNPTATSYDTRLRALGWYAQACTRSHALTYVRPAVDEALRVLAAATALDKKKIGGESSLVAVRAIARYHRFLRAMADCEEGEGTTAMSLPSAVQDQMASVVHALLKELEGLSTPTMPHATLALRPISLNAFMSPRLLTSVTVSMIIAHLKKAEVYLTPSQWLAAATVNLHAGDMEHSMKCLAHAARGVDIDFSHRLMAAQGARTLAQTVKMLEPIVAGLPASTEVGADDRETGVTSADTNTTDKPSPPKDTSPATNVEAKAGWSTTMRAWSILLARAATDDSVTAKQLSSLASSLPDDMSVSFTLTPVMHGLVKRGDLVNARKVWRSMQTRYTAASRDERPKLLDAAALSVGAELQFQRAHDFDPLKHPLNAVDFYAARPQQGRFPDKVRPGGGREIQLDTQVLNVLLNQAARAGRPGIAFRLWEAALPRWGVWQDDISLTLVLNGALTCVERGFDPGLDSLRGRLRALAGAIHSLPSAYTPNETDWRNAPLLDLLDPPRYSWHEEHGSEQPWVRARALFRSVVLGNWPALASMPSPLGSRSFFGIADLLSPRSLPMGGHMPPPSPDARYSHIIPSAATWQAYMSILRTYGAEWGDGAAAEDEVARALVWMRALGTKPTWRTVLEALVHVGDHEGARRRVRIGGRTVLARDEEILRAWLTEWLGEVPSESDVAAFRRLEMSGGGK